jgi:folate-binding protein YgfZ
VSQPPTPPHDPAALRRLREEGGRFPITGRARFAVTGADRLRYLNGQVSNDLRKLEPGAAMPACVLSAKGRLDALVFVWIDGERLIVESDAELAEALGARLERYVVADDVVIEPLALEAEIHIFGPAATAGGRKISRIGAPGLDLPATAAPSAIAEALPELLELLRIERRIPAWGHELGPDTLPAEAGLDRIAVDFYKGCYIGQEVVSRIQSVGHANRSLHSFRTADERLPAIGAPLFEIGKPGHPAGVVTSAALHFELSCGTGLCYIKRGVDPASLLETAPAPAPIRIQLCQLPCE